VKNCFATAAEWTRRVADLPATPLPSAVLMADPAAFAVAAVHNPHMAGADGTLHAVDPARARAQWLALAAAYARCGVRVEVMPAVPGLADLCFSANPVLALPTPAGQEVWAARMTHASRRPEVAAHRAWFATRGIALRELPQTVKRFEGGGDGIPHPGRFLLHAGIGPRSERAAWEALAQAHPDLDLLIYELHDARFYHLDTALAALDERSCLYVPEAFDAHGITLLQSAFDDAIPVPPEEARNFAGNAHCPDGRHVLLQRGSPLTEAALRERNFTPMPLDTGEFLKSGGSVFCLKQAITTS
jgi:N-dimethylarginine dimethylaminohydrolase